MHCNNTIPFVSNHAWRYHGWHIQIPTSGIEHLTFPFPFTVFATPTTLTNHTTAATGVVRPRAKQLGRPTGCWKRLGQANRILGNPPFPQLIARWLPSLKKSIFGEWERDAPVALPLWLASNHLILSPEEMHAISNRSLSITYVHNHQYHGECNDPKWHWRPFKSMRFLCWNQPSCWERYHV